MAAQTFLAPGTNNTPTVTQPGTTGGSGDANKIAAFDASGKLTAAMMPAGIGPDVFTCTVGAGALSAGQLVAIVNSSGVPNADPADNTNSRPAFGYVNAAFSAAATATVYKYGTITGLTGLTIGGLCFLGTAGAITQTPVAPGSGYISQVIGVASSSTTVEFNPQMYIQC